MSCHQPFVEMPETTRFDVALAQMSHVILKKCEVHKMKRMMIDKIVVFLVLITFFAVFPSLFAEAADDPSSICITNGVFDKDKCTQEARWIAAGTAIDVHTLSYPPQDKRMTEFTLLVAVWEKGTKRIKKNQELRHLTGYSSSLSSGDLVRVYGYERVKYLPDKKYGAHYIESFGKKEYQGSGTSSEK